jgi:hypothetical protein
MRAAVLRKAPRFEEFPEPTPGEGEVLIHVCAAALKPVDKQLAGGKHDPARANFQSFAARMALGGSRPLVPQLRPCISREPQEASAIRLCAVRFLSQRRFCSSLQYPRGGARLASLSFRACGPRNLMKVPVTLLLSMPEPRLSTLFVSFG